MLEPPVSDFSARFHNVWGCTVHLGGVNLLVQVSQTVQAAALERRAIEKKVTIHGPWPNLVRSRKKNR